MSDDIVSDLAARLRSLADPRYGLARGYDDAQQTLNEAADEIVRLREIVYEYEQYEADDTLTPEEVEAILNRYILRPFTIPGADTGSPTGNK